MSVNVRKYSILRPRLGKQKRDRFKKQKSTKNTTSNSNHLSAKYPNHHHHHQDDYKQLSPISKKQNRRLDKSGGNSVLSHYGKQSLINAKRNFGDEKFNILQHIKELFAQTSTADIDDVLKYLNESKTLTSNFLSNKVKYQYKEFISMSRNVLEIEDQMTEMDDMLKSMSVSLKSLHETNFGMLQLSHLNSLNQRNSIGINDEEQRDRERQEMEVLESMQDQILQHIQLRQLQQATDLIVTAKNEQVNLKLSVRKRVNNFINAHIHELEALIIDQLSSSSYLPQIKRDKLSTLLMRLGFVDQAMELYLEHKSKALKQTIRQISLYGDVKQYIQDLSKVFFDEIINSSNQYSNLLNKIEINQKEEDEQKADYTKMDTNQSTNPFDSFNQFDDDQKESVTTTNDDDRFSYKNSMHMSRLIVWIYKELETYEKLFEQQVFQLEQNDFRTIGECLKIVFKQSTRLDQSGIHVSFLLSNHFQPSIESAITRLYRRKLENIKKLTRRENYLSKSKNVSNASKNTKSKMTIKKFKRKSLAPANNPFTQNTDSRRRSQRHSRIVPIKKSDSVHQRRSSEIFGDVSETKQDDEDNENMSELRRLSQRRTSKTKQENATNSANNSAQKPSLSTSTIQRDTSSQFTVVKLTKSGQEMYEVVKKCIQETWRLLDQRYYGELTKSVYRTVITQMIYLVQVYSSQITQQINERAPSDLTTYCQTLSQFANSSSKKSKKSKRHQRKSSKTNKKVGTILENKQFKENDDEKGTANVKMDSLKPQSSLKNVAKNNNSSSSSKYAVPDVLNEAQMLSLIANVYYVSEDLLTRIAHRYQKLFGRQIPELELFAIEQQKLYNAQFQQFSKKFLYKWVNEKLLWTNDKICKIYAEKPDISIVTKEEIATWNVSKEMLGFVRYIVNLRLEIDKYLGANKDNEILRDSIETLLSELFNGEYIPKVSNHQNNDENNENLCITPYGLNRLYLDFRFLMITCANFLSANSKHLITSICEKAKKYVNAKYNLRMNVDWKLMHSLGMRLQYKALSGDELDVLNKSYLSGQDNSDNLVNNSTIGLPTQSRGRSSVHAVDMNQNANGNTRTRNYKGTNPFG